MKVHHLDQPNQQQLNLQVLLLLLQFFENLAYTRTFHALTFPVAGLDLTLISLATTLVLAL